MNKVERTASGGAAQPPPRRVGLEATMRAELTAILEGREFRRSPVLSRLLHYLVEQTLSGAGDRLKAYAIAVDGLGRPENFDAQHDSYPRVQMVRLRKALDLHYAETAPVDGLCLSLVAGSYRVRVGRPETAYHHLYRQGTVAETALLPTADLVADRPRPLTSRCRAALRVSGLVLLVVLLTVVWRLAPLHRATADRGVSPLLEIGVSGPSATTAQTPAERQVAAVLVDGIRRSWTTRVRDSGGPATPGDAADYRLGFSLDAADPGHRLMIQLTDRSSAVVWSANRALSGNPDVLAEELGPVIARLSGPTGAIAAREAARAAGKYDTDYRCLLGYFAFLQTRDPATRTRVAACLSRPPTEKRLAPTVLAANAFLTLEGEPGTDLKPQLRTAELFAQRALQADADDPYAQFAMARLSYVQSDCVAGNHHTALAMAANPNDPMIAAVLSGWSVLCSYPQAAALLDRAFLLRDEGDINVRSFLIFASISQERPERLRELGLIVRPPPGPLLARYLLLEGMGAAAQGRRAEARADWTEFGKLYPRAGPTPDDKLRTMILSEPIRRRTIEILRRGGAIPGE